MQKATIAKILNMDTYFEYKWEGTYIYDEEAHDEDPTTGVISYILFTDPIAREILRTLYGSRIYCDFDDESEDVNDLLANFKQSWRIWISSRDENMGPLMYALQQKYNPIENFHSSEIKLGTIIDETTQTLEFDNRKDITKDDSFIEHSFSQYKETEKINETNKRNYGTGETAYKETNTVGEMTHTDKTSADDAIDFVNAAQGIDAQHTDSKKIENSITDEHYTNLNGNTKEIEGSWKDAHGIPENGSGNVVEKTGSETTKNGGEKRDNYTLERYGNIGVTTTQQMLESSYELAKKNIIYIMLREFVEMYTYFSAEVD